MHAYVFLYNNLFNLLLIFVLHWLHNSFPFDYYNHWTVGQPIALCLNYWLKILFWEMLLLMPKYHDYRITTGYFQIVLLTRHSQVTTRRSPVANYMLALPSKNTFVWLDLLYKVKSFT